MADRTHLRAAANNDIADDDPFAELTRIMGFDPRQPVRPQTPAQPKAAPAGQPVDDGDFDIDLEKELMGEFGADDNDGVAEVREPAFEAAPMDDEVAASLEQDFLLDDDATDETVHAVTAADLDLGAAELSAPAVNAAFDDNFDDAIASSLEDVSPFEDDLAVANDLGDDRLEDDQLAVSLEQDLLLDDDAANEAELNAASAEVSVPAVDPVDYDEFDDAVASSLEDELTLDEHVPLEQAAAAEVPAPAAEPDFDDEFDNAISSSLEDELMLDEHVAMEQAAVEAPAAPVQAVSDESDEDFAGHFDEAMADVDMDFDVRTDELAEIDQPEIDEPEVVPAGDELAAAAPKDAFDDDFDLNFDDALVDEIEEPVAQVASVAPQPTAPAVAAVQPAAAIAPIAEERSLEDELNALLGAMSTRSAPMAAAAAAPAPKEPAMAQQPVAAAEKAVGKPVDPVSELDWDLDEHAQVESAHADVVQAADADLDTFLLDELKDQDFGAEDAAGSEDADFDSDDLNAAFARDIGLDHDAADDGIAADAGKEEPHDSLGWRTTRSTPPEPARSWSRVTPVANTQPAFASQPVASAKPAATPPPAMVAAPSRQEEPTAVADTAYAAPAPAEQPSAFDEMPDVETVDVPERVVALADDLDIPEINFDEAEPAAPAYDDLDADFANLLTEMNAVDVAPASVRSAAYDDESYNAGFNSGYQRDRVETRTYAARPTETPASAAYVDAAGGFDLGELPGGGKPVSQADDFALDELDYDPELDEAMSVPGLAEQEAARPRSRGLLIAAVVGAVAIAGGLGAFALSFGGKGSGDAPVIVKADNAPIKVKPENPGGTVVPNQDNKVYDAVAKGTKPAEPVQEKLVTNTEEPVDVTAKEPPQSRVVDLGDTNAVEGTDAAGGTQAAGDTQAAGNADVAAAPAPKSEDRIAQVLQEAEKSGNPDIVAVAPRKVRTMVVKSDGSLVAREDPAPAAPQVAAVEPVDPEPQRVAPSAQADDAAQTGTVPPASGQAIDDQANSDQAEPVQPETVKPAAAPEAKAQSANTQSANTPETVPLAPQRPSDQPVDVVGEVKPDQVASIPTTASTGGGSWSMQIASQPTVESAQSSYADLQRRFGSVLAGRTANIVKAEIAGKGTFYRVRVPAQSRNDAISLCTSYKAAGGNCFVSR